MASRILLISANRCATPEPVFPLGLSHLTAALRQAGHDIHWVDFQAGSEPLSEVLASYRPHFIGVSLRNIDDVLIRKQETYFDELSSLCATLRRLAGCPLILGGSGFSIFPRELLALAGADFGICGEGEVALPSLLAALEQGKPCDAIPGLVFHQNGQIVVNPPSAGAPAPPLQAEDRPPKVVAHYLQATGILNVQTQRGCAFRCCYCTYPLIEGRTHRRHPPEAVAKEFAQVQRLGARYAFIVDSVFNSSPRHVTEICEAILRANVKLSWGCFLRPQGLTPDLMKLMARAGLSHIEFGSDSLCDEVLAAYQKGFTFEDILRSSELARKERVDFCHYLIAGGPGETPATLLQGFAQSQRLQGAVLLAVVGMRVYPGTHLCERAVTEGRLPHDANLLTPAYYVSPALTADAVFAQLQEFARISPNWIVGDPAPAYASLVARLRQRGVVGPLWSYFSMMQRLWPQAVG